MVVLRTNRWSALSKANTNNGIDPNDLMIASIALTHQLVLVTHNIREFFRVDGLQVEDWE
ncbi:hypothetical protein [Candidatus Competibacter phosphatis]|uniref:hypothetical protein n=1 Tax=Candidatus Competibacter phosphatis TaxID=221280 RepID=UPI0030B9603C